MKITLTLEGVAGIRKVSETGVETRQEFFAEPLTLDVSFDDRETDTIADAIPAILLGLLGGGGKKDSTQMCEVKDCDQPVVPDTAFCTAHDESDLGVDADR